MSQCEALFTCCFLMYIRPLLGQTQLILAVGNFLLAFAIYIYYHCTLPHEHFFFFRHRFLEAVSVGIMRIFYPYYYLPTLLLPMTGVMNQVELFFTAGLIRLFYVRLPRRYFEWFHLLDVSFLLVACITTPRQARYAVSALLTGLSVLPLAPCFRWLRSRWLSVLVALYICVQFECLYQREHRLYLQLKAQYEAALALRLAEVEDDLFEESGSGEEDFASLNSLVEVFIEGPDESQAEPEGWLAYLWRRVCNGKTKVDKFSLLY